MDELKTAFSVANCFALAGGLLGAMFIALGQHKQIRNVTVLLIGLSVVMSATVADYLFPPKPWLYAGIGVFVGMISSALLDAFKAAAPKLAQRIIDVIGDIAVSIVEKIGKK